MKNKNVILKSAFLLIAGCASACQSNTATTVGTNTAENKTANAVRADNKNAVPTEIPPPANISGTANQTAPNDSLATPTAAYKFAYAARKNKDVEGLKRVLSKDALEFMQIFSEPGESVDKALLQMTEKPQAATDESRNEKITGDKATLEYPEAGGKWRTADFIKENGEWKMTIPKGDDIKIESGMPPKQPVKK